MKKGLRFLLADDHAIVRKGLKQILKDEFPDGVVSEVADGPSVIKSLETQSFDLLICDINMPGVTGLELCKRVKEMCPDLPVLVLSMYSEEQYAIRALRNGASGYMTKESAPDELIKAVRQLLVGKKFVSASLAALMVDHLGGNNQLELHENLSDRELEVLRLIATGKSITQIGDALNLSPNTISTYRARILEKMKMKNNAQLIQYAIEHQLA
ncbi:MAG: response regulator transcription factor [Cytophagales bacterium]|nr:response regulator transcription factor [Cytophagales bacterium]